MKKFMIGAAVWAAASVATTAPARAACGGDCSGDGEVTVNEIILGVNIALGSAVVGSCSSFDTNGDGDVTINEIINAVNSALNGCPPAAPTPTATATRTPTTGVVSTPTPAIVPPGISAVMLGIWSGHAVNETTQVMKTARIKIEVSGGKVVVTDLGGNVFKTHALTITMIPTPTAIFSLAATEQLQLSIVPDGTNRELAGSYSTVKIAIPPQVDAVALVLQKES